MLMKGRGYIDIAKLVDIHEDGYYSFVSKPRNGATDSFILRRDELNIKWVGVLAIHPYMGALLFTQEEWERGMVSGQLFSFPSQMQ